MHWLEKWLIPPRCVVTQVATRELDLSEGLIEQLVSPYGEQQAVCPVCCELSYGGAVCGKCLTQPPAFDRTQVGYYFDEPLTQLVYDLKYHQQYANGRLLAALLATQIESQGVQALIAVPIHPLRRRQRGYNQAGSIAESLADILAIPLLKNAVVRVINTPSQTHLSAQKRQENLKKAFKVNPDVLQGYTRVALVDDVITTGATMQQLAQQLKKDSDLEIIQAWAVAKTK